MARTVHSSMVQPDAVPRAVVLLIIGGEQVELCRFESDTCCDLGLIDHLARLQLAALRSGCAIRVVDADSETRALIDLVGLSTRLGITVDG